MSCYPDTPEPRQSPLLDERQRDLFDRYRSRLKGMPVSHIWTGYGTAIFLEFGTLTPSTKLRRDGSNFNDRGEFSVMIDSSWRIETDKQILCGSGFDEAIRARMLNELIGKSIEDLLIIDHIFELFICFSNTHSLSSYSDYSENPEWAIFDNVTRSDQSTSISVQGGCLTEQRSNLSTK